jgi:hypothetical protein
MLKNQPYLRLLLSFVATAIFILAAYFVAAYFLDTFLTTYRWQIKALAIYNLIGGTQESWWTEKATSIAWDLLLNNQNIMGWVWTGAVSALTRIFLLGKGS